jgi:uncharacterized protein YndB with AHSA1/START domain
MGAMDLVAHTAVVIRASRRAVWRSLMAPETVPQIMPVTKVVVPWRLGQPFLWEFAFGGTASRVEGQVLRVEDERLLAYDYGDPHSRDVLGVPDHIHRVTIELTGEAGETRISVTQDANRSEAARAHAEGGWRLALNHLKGLVEASGEQDSDARCP